MQGHVAKAFGVPVSAGRCEGSKLNAQIAGRSPGGRPLRRRREMMLICDRQRLRGTAALHVAIAHRCHDRMGQKLEQARADLRLILRQVRFKLIPAQVRMSEPVFRYWS